MKQSLYDHSNNIFSPKSCNGDDKKLDSLQVFYVCRVVSPAGGFEEHAVGAAAMHQQDRSHFR